VFGRVEMGIRAGGIDEGADGVAIFYAAKTRALEPAWSQNRRFLNGIRVALPGALSPYFFSTGPGVRIFLGHRDVL
jgi:hypothetical protein